MLSALSTRRRVPGHADRPTLLNANPSYLGMLAEEGAVLGMGPGDFGLRRIFTGGELVTAGLRERLVALFGDIDIQETYTATETVPFGARRCRHGHLHFEPTHGLLELVNPLTGRSAEPGEVATIVTTTLPPLRESTLLVRYDTEDVVYALQGEPDCELRHQPACSPVMGKLSGCARLDDDRLVCPRQIAEALESSRSVPLPARYWFRGVGDAVAVEAVVRDRADDGARRDIVARLLDAGVPLGELRLVDNAGAMSQPLSLRADLREPVFKAARLPLNEASVA
jgi:hypothetical protein